MELQYTKQAKQEFLRIVEIYGEFSGPISANKFIDKINNINRMLIKHPYIGHPEEFLANRKHPYRSKSITKYYRMIYYQEGETIWVVDFWDSRQDPAKLSKRIM